MLDRSQTVRGTVLGALLTTAVALAALQGQAAGRNPDVPVTSTIATSQSGVGLRVEGDVQGAYITTSQVTSMILGSNHDWILQTYFNSKNKTMASGRSVFFDLTEPVSPSNPVPPITAGYQQAFLNIACSRANIDLLAMTAGTTVLCPGHFKFLVGSEWYRIGFNSDNFPEVDPIRVTCNAAAAGGCTRWSAAPSGTSLTGTDPNPKNVGKLLHIDAAGNILGDLGDYFVSFAIGFSR